MIPQRERSAYANFRNYAVWYDMERHTFSCWYAPAGRIVDGAGITGVYDKTGNLLFTPADYSQSAMRWEQNMDDTTLTIEYAGGPEEQRELTLRFVVSKDGIRLGMQCRGDLDFRISGALCWGEDMEHDTFAMCIDRPGMDLRSGLGPASSTVDNALFDRKNDRALEFYGYSSLRLNFDWEARGWRFLSSTDGNDYVRGFSLRVQEQVYGRKFGVPYRPINKNNTFSVPPCGWMTWYSVQFDAGEKTVLENARWQKEHLADFGADVIWVDWEWYHSSFAGKGPEGVHAFSPDKDRYPNGMDGTAKKIEELDLIPAIWIGATNEPARNADIDGREDMVLLQKPSWCGEYFFDLSHPAFLSDYVPRVFRQLKDWGYKALKWDCLPITMEYADKYHGAMYDTALTSEQAMRQVVQAAREAVGENFYMLSCSGDSARDIGMCIDLFDAARIGGDIFQWSEFISACVARVMKFYAFHNVLHYNDPDNVVIRPKFNTYDQAQSRAAFVSLLGLPVTLGDSLPDLPEDRVELLKRILPALDIHPMDVRETCHDYRVVKMNLAVNRPFGQWNVVNLLNLGEEPAEASFSIREELHLEDGEYLVYDYWNQEFLGAVSQSITLSLRPCASRTLAVHRRLDRPQLLSTSRHITQGGVDLLDLKWDAGRRTLSGVSRVVKGDPYRIVLYVPEQLRVAPEGNDTVLVDWENPCPEIWQTTYCPDETGKFRWSVQFDTNWPKED